MFSFSSDALLYKKFIKFAYWSVGSVFRYALAEPSGLPFFELGWDACILVELWDGEVKMILVWLFPDLVETGIFLYS